MRILVLSGRGRFADIQESIFSSHKIMEVSFNKVEYVAPAARAIQIKPQSIICQSNPNEVPDMEEGWTLNF